MTMRIVHLGDLHFGAHSESVANALIEDVSTVGPDSIVVSGDFTQIGSVAEFRAAKAFLDALPVPVIAVPGNHDIPTFNLWERFTDPYGRYRSFISEDLEPFVQFDGVVVAGLKTTRRALWGFDWSDGAISRGQLRRLSMRLNELPDDVFKIVVAHHPLLHPEEGGIGQDIVGRADRALAAFAKAGVRLVLSGHFHKSYVRQHVAPVELDAVANTTNGNLPVLALQTDSAISTRLRGRPNGYNIVELAGDTVNMRRRIWNGDAWAEGEQLVAAT